VPTLDDEFLDTLLRHAGDSFTVPSSGPSAILGRVHRDDDETAAPGQAAMDAGDSAAPPASTVRGTVRGTIGSTLRGHKMLAVAASVLVLLLVAGGALWLGNGTSKSTAGLRSASATHSLHAPNGVSQKSAGSAGSTSTGSTASPGFAAASGSNAAVPATSTSGAPSNSSDSQNTTPGPSAASLGVGQPARIEQTGSLDLSVGRGALSATVQRLNALAAADGGFVANSQTQSGAAGGAPSGTVILEVPVASFSAVLHQAQSLGKVSQLTTSATDVTGQYVDLQSRITALEASRQQYLTIMTKASSIGDVLAVQAQLDSLQSQIEQLQGQLAVLSSETDYSKLTIAVGEAGAPHHHAAVVDHPGLTKAWHDSVHGFVAGAEGVIRIAGPALFALLCLGAVVLGGQLFWRRLQRHNL
jgi:Domain of unknown function (DUF4349)